jgi:Zn-finger nucleic acid-binding protein
MSKCPRCDSELREVVVNTSTGSRTAVEACLDGCAGIWVGKEDLLAGLQPAMSDELLSLQSGAAEQHTTRFDFLEVEEARRCGPKVVLTPELLEKYIQCIRCGKEMMRYRWNLTSVVILDECPDGHGIWIDAGEIMQMRQFLQVEEADSAKQDDVRARLAQVKAEYELNARRCGRHLNGDSPLSWLFGILFKNGF